MPPQGSDEAPAAKVAKLSHQGPDPCPHSVANFREAVVSNLTLDLEVDFSRQIFFGQCELQVRAVDPARPPSEVLLDVLALKISKVTDEKGELLHWEVRKASGLKAQFGEALAVRWPSRSSSQGDCTMRIVYETTAGSTAICWLTPEQTQGKTHPLVFTQSQAICGRSLLPCQDTPCVKQPFTWRMSVPTPLTAVASGQRVGEPQEDTPRPGLRTFVYRQEIPVMSYLLAVIIAELEERSIGPRSKIYAEPAVVAAAQAEYGADLVEDYITTAQKIVGGCEYVWGSYNLAVMPTSFGYGGMENPNCTFISASLIAGDRSLTTTLAHEIVHSWSGNLVTNAYHKDFWLNEGFTRYIERRVLGQLFGKAFRSLVLVVGYGDLVKSIEMLRKQGTPGLTCLEPDIDHMDPDDAFSRVPYEKGSLFLYYLEKVVGSEEKMTEWLQKYINDFKGKSIETKDFQEHFGCFFKGTAADQVDWQHWIKGTGLPDFDLQAHTDDSLLKKSKALANLWIEGGQGSSSEDLSSMKAQQIMLFLDHLIESTNAGKAPSLEALESMERLYRFSSTRNVEVAFRWCVLGCKCHWNGVLAPTQAFLASHGRGMYVKPLYMAFNDFKPDSARETFQRNRAFYMALIARGIAKVLGV